MGLTSNVHARCHLPRDLEHHRPRGHGHEMDVEVVGVKQYEGFVGPDPAQSGCRPNVSDYVSSWVVIISTHNLSKFRLTGWAN